jgi:hypothetical protein
MQAGLGASPEGGGGEDAAHATARSSHRREEGERAVGREATGFYVDLRERLRQIDVLVQSLIAIAFVVCQTVVKKNIRV